MAMPHSATDWTVDMLDSLPDDGKRYEIIDGELIVTPSPVALHQYAVADLCQRLNACLAGSGIGRAIVSPADVRVARTSSVQPDVFVVPAVDGRAPLTYPEAGELLLVIEVRSPGTAKIDRGKKRRFYQRVGVPEYWVVDCDAETIERWRGIDERSEVLGDRIEWQPAGAERALVIELPEFFQGLTKI